MPGTYIYRVRKSETSRVMTIVWLFTDFVYSGLQYAVGEL